MMLDICLEAFWQGISGFDVDADGPERTVGRVGVQLLGGQLEAIERQLCGIEEPTNC